MNLFNFHFDPLGGSSLVLPHLCAVYVHVVRVLGAFAQLGPVLQISYKISTF